MNIKTSKDRRWKRYPLDVRVRVVIVTENGNEVIHGRSRAISEGGIGVTLTRELSKGMLVNLHFKLPESDRERIYQAQLKYRSGFHSGFEFIGVQPHERLELREFCESLEGKSSADVAEARA